MGNDFRAPPGLEAFLASSPSETTPVLLELARGQAARRGPAELVRQMGTDLYVAPGALDLRTVHRLDGMALEAAREFEAVLLSPVAPLGTCSSVALTGQHRVLTANRGTEVVSDPTNVLALLAARRLAADAEATVRTCTLHQVVRAQPLPPGKGFTRHFRLFAACEAGKARAEDGFEVEALVRQVGVFDRILDAWASAGGRVGGRRLVVRSVAGRSVLKARLLARLAGEFPHMDLAEGEPPPAYYDGLRVLYELDGPEGRRLQIGDLGIFDWMARLTANRRMRLVASGLGIQLLPLVLGPGYG